MFKGTQKSTVIDIVYFKYIHHIEKKEKRGSMNAIPNRQHWTDNMPTIELLIWFLIHLNECGFVWFGNCFVADFSSFI